MSAAIHAATHISRRFSNGAKAPGVVASPCNPGGDRPPKWRNKIGPGGPSLAIPAEVSLVKFGSAIARSPSRFFPHQTVAGCAP